MMAATMTDVRNWATSKGMSVGTRGKLGKHVVEAYNKSHPKTPYGKDDEVIESSTADATETIPQGMPVHISRKRVDGKEIVTVTFEVAAN